MTSKEKVLGVYPTVYVTEGPMCWEHYKHPDLKSLSIIVPFGFINHCVKNEDVLWDWVWDYISDFMLRKLES
jgi:hypothetical protein